MKRHNADVASLVFGLLFLGVSVMWSLMQFDVMGLPGLEIAAPVLLVSIGLAGLVASLGRMRGKREDSRP
jgi:hypothetical protein